MEDAGKIIRIAKYITLFFRRVLGENASRFRLQQKIAIFGTDAKRNDIPCPTGMCHQIFVEAHQFADVLWRLLVIPVIRQFIITGVVIGNIRDTCLTLKKVDS